MLISKAVRKLFQNYRSQLTYNWITYKNTNFEDLYSALEDGKVEGALLDTYIAAEHKDELFNDKIFVKEILDRPFGYGVFPLYQERQ